MSPVRAHVAGSVPEEQKARMTVLNWSQPLPLALLGQPASPGLAEIFPCASAAHLYRTTKQMCLVLKKNMGPHFFFIYRQFAGAY